MDCCYAAAVNIQRNKAKHVSERIISATGKQTCEIRIHPSIFLFFSFNFVFNFNFNLRLNFRLNFLVL